MSHYSADSKYKNGLESQVSQARDMGLEIGVGAEYFIVHVFS
jgi:hypothetical protein